MFHEMLHDTIHTELSSKPVLAASLLTLPRQAKLKASLWLRGRHREEHAKNLTLMKRSETCVTFWQTRRCSHRGRNEEAQVSLPEGKQVRG